MAGAIRVGIGGWTFAPWRGTFYPDDLKQKDELAWASRHLTAIEINGTYYSGFKPATFAGWAAQAPAGFVFAVKGSRFCANRRVLAEGAESVRRFFAQGIAELGEKLGPILWQFMATKRFDRDDFAGFLDLLPTARRHVVEVRHDSFKDARFVDLCRERGIAICLADHDTYPMLDEATADFVYARLMRGHDETPTCYPPAEIAAWAERFKAVAPRDVFAFFIGGGKVRAPTGAMALMEKVGV